MSRSLPPEIFDLIIEDLYDDPTALKACCLVSKSWVPRTRRHLFARILFHRGRSTIRSWTETFPDPFNSPGHHTRDLRIYEPLPNKRAWIHYFQHVEKLSIIAFEWGTNETCLVQLHGLSPTIKSLHLVHPCIPSPAVFNLVYSFPLLEDLTICRGEAESDSSYEWVAPPTLPKFTGTLHLIEEIRSTALPLLALPNGLHFTKIMASCPIGDGGLVMDLVSRCSDTLESLCVDYCSSTAFSYTPEVCSTLMLITRA